MIGKRAASLDVKGNTLTLDDGSKVEYDDCMIATGSSLHRVGRCSGAMVPG